MNSEPRHRKVGVQDVSANRNLGFLGLAGAIFFGYAGVSRVGQPGPPTFAAGIALSMAITLSLLGGYMLWCSRFLAHNIDQPIGFFRAFDARAYFATTVAFFVVGPALATLSIVAYFSGDHFISGLLVGPAGLLLFGAVGRATGAVTPL